MLFVALSASFPNIEKPHISLIYRVLALCCRLLLSAPGAENGTRTRDLDLGKVALYQLSYFRNYRFRTGGTTASAPRLRASKPAFRDCKYKPKNLFCKIFRRILSQNYSCAARKRRKKKRRCRCDRAGMPGANAQQRTATKIRLPKMAALFIYGSPSERIPISGP